MFNHVLTSKEKEKWIDLQQKAPILHVDYGQLTKEIQHNRYLTKKKTDEDSPLYNSLINTLYGAALPYYEGFFSQECERDREKEGRLIPHGLEFISEDRIDKEELDKGPVVRPLFITPNYVSIGLGFFPEETKMIGKDIRDKVMLYGQSVDELIEKYVPMACLDDAKDEFKNHFL